MWTCLPASRGFIFPSRLPSCFLSNQVTCLRSVSDSPKGEPIYHGFAKLDSATKPYKMHIGTPLVKRKEIRVTRHLFHLMEPL